MFILLMQLREIETTSDAHGKGRPRRDIYAS